MAQLVCGGDHALFWQCQRSGSLTGTAAFADAAYQLNADSSAIDAGLDAGVTHDYFGNPRPQGSGYDIGYAESPFDGTITGLVAQNSSPTMLGSDMLFTASISTGASVSYVWDFGNAITATGAHVSYVYPVVGTYTATVTATNGLGSSSASTLVTVTPLIRLYLPLVMHHAPAEAPPGGAASPAKRLERGWETRMAGLKRTR